MLLAWLAGVAGAVPGVRSLTSPAARRDRSRCRRLPPRQRPPLAILRLGLALQLAVFVVLVAID
jgi:hypothetical protein